MSHNSVSILNKKRLLTPGPTPLPEEVRLMLATQMIHHRTDAFRQIMAGTQVKLGQLFCTANPVLPLSCSGTGAMTAAVTSLFNPGEKVLVIEAGKFGERWGEIARSRNLEAITLKIPWGTAPDLDRIEETLKRIPGIAGVLIQLCETSTGAMLPVKDVAGLARKSGALCIVDGISGVGVSPCPMDEWRLDCLLTGSQKGLMLPPGLALIALSASAWEKASKVTPGCYYFNLAAEKSNIKKNQTNFTTPVNLIMGLSKSLDILLEDGLSAIYRKQWALTALVREGVRAMGLKPFVETNFSWGVTAIKMPESIDAAALLNNIQEKYGIVMAGGQDSLKGKIIRLGHMGWVDWADCLAGLMAISESLKKIFAHPVNPGFEAAAMQAYSQALADGYPENF